MSFGDRPQVAKEDMGITLRRIPQTAHLASSSLDPKFESYPPMQRLQRHSADSLSTSSGINSRHLSQLVRTPALYYGCAGPRNQAVAEQSRVMVQHPTAFRYTASNPPALVVPQISHRKTVSTMDSTIIHRCPAKLSSQSTSAGSDVAQNDVRPQTTVDHDRPRNLRIRTEFSPSTTRAADLAYQHGLPGAISVLITKNFDTCYFINLPKGIFPGSIVDKIFARYDIPQQDRSSWSIFRATGVQPVGHALDALQLWEECLEGLVTDREKVSMFIILPCSTELMSSHLAGLLNPLDCPPDYEETIPSASQVLSPEHPLSVEWSPAPEPPASSYEYQEEVNGYLTEEPDPDPVLPSREGILGQSSVHSRGSISRRVSFIEGEHVTSISKYLVTPPIETSELESSPEVDLRAFYSQERPQWLPWHSPDDSVNENATESPFQYRGSLSPGHSERPDSSKLSESSSDRIPQPLCSRESGQLFVLQENPTSPSGKESSSKLKFQDQCKPAPVQGIDPIEVRLSVRSFPAPSDSRFSSTDSQLNTGEPSSEDFENNESTFSDDKESFSTCSSSSFPHLQQNGQTEDSNTSQIDSSNNDITWLDDLIEKSFFKPSTEVVAGITLSLPEDPRNESPPGSSVFKDCEAESDDGPVSGDFQVPMESGPALETDYDAIEAHLPPHDGAQQKRQPLQTGFGDCEKTERNAESEENIFAGRCWATRPNIQKVCDHLETSFPNHNVDQPIVRILKNPQNDHQSQQESPSQGVQRVLSIRSSVSSRKQKRVQSSLTTVDPPQAAHFPETLAEPNQVHLYSSPLNSIKLWGYKTEEILPGSQAEVAPGSFDAESSSTSLKWVKGKLIGCGSFGMVYLALDLTNQAMMAVKQVKIGDQSSNRPFVKPAIESIKLEIHFLKDLEHPSIVQYLGFEDTPKHCNIFLEYVEGGSIGSCVSKHGKLEREVVKSFTKQILEGLEYLHSCNIMHRDLKADNVLVDMMGRCKISDFGISKRSNEAYLTSQYTPMQGTVFSMAPEVFNQPIACRYSAKADIWSLGCLVLEMLCGSRAWHGYGSLQIIYKVGIERRTPDIPQELQTDRFQNHFLRKCLEIQPCARPTARRLIDHIFLELDPEWEFQKSQLFKLL